MFDFGLNLNQRLAYQSLLLSHHSIEVGVTILDLNHNELSRVTNRLLDGQVTVDADGAVSRGLDMDLLDPTHALHLDSNSPDDGAMFADRMIRVHHAIINPTGTVRYNCPIFTGPIHSLERSGVAVQVQALGKESLGMSPAWNARTFKKGTQVTDAIVIILRDVIGENKMVIPDLASKLPRNVSVGDDRLPWPTAKSLASSIGYHLFFDAMGICRMRRMSSAHLFTFSDGRGGSIKTEPQLGFDIENTINAVEVWGKKPEKKGKKRPHARVIAPRSHPLSPWSLGGDGTAGNRKPRYLVEEIEDDGVTTDAEARQRANRRLQAGLLESMTVKFDSMVVPHLEEMDVVRVASDRVTENFRIRQFAIPLTAQAQMSVGYVKNVKPNKSAIRARAARK